MTGRSEDPPLVYAVRFAIPASDRIVEEYERLEEINGFEIAEQWRKGLLTALQGLATYPERCAVARENDIFQQVVPGQTLRQLVYRRTRNGPAWRILFSVHAMNDQDSPTVRVRRIQHGAQAPLTEWEGDAE